MISMNTFSLTQYQKDIQETKLPPEVLAFLMAEFIAIKVQPDSHNTRLAYQEDLRKLGEFCMGDISDRKLLAFKLKGIDRDRDGNARAARTANRILSTCREFLRFLQMKRIVAHNYYDLIDGQKVDKLDSPYVALSDIQVRAMIDTPDRNSALGRSQRLALILFFYMGIRCAELCQIRYQDIQSGAIMIRGKGKKVRFLPINEIVQVELSGYIDGVATTLGTPDQKRHLIESRESHGDMVNPSTVWRWFTGVAKLAGVDVDGLRDIGKKVSPHTGRATAITKALDAGVGIREVSSLAGHSSIETTALYDKRRGEAAKVAALAIKY